MKTNVKAMGIVMLPTEKSKILFINNDELFLCKEEVSQLIIGNKREIPQHLHIISDAKIKEGDWCYFGHSKEIGQFTSKDTMPSNLFKIEATTDSSLWHDETKEINFNKVIITNWQIPQIPQSFISAFIKAEGKIKEVNVEVESRGHWHFERSSGYAGFRCNNCSTWIYEIQEKKCDCGFKIKIRPDNSIIIHPSKTYSRAEVDKFLLDVMNLGMSLRQDQLSGCSNKSGAELLEKYKEENL